MNRARNPIVHVGYEGIVHDRGFGGGRAGTGRLGGGCVGVGSGGSRSAGVPGAGGGAGIGSSAGRITF